MTKVSVIIPVYNAGPYLRRCLDSVCGQTLRSIEIICIDDASTDGSAAILREYAEKDGRVRVLELPRNHGPSAARNAGLELAIGDYVGFVDSDDWPERDFYAILLSAAETAGADIAKGCYRDSESKAIDVTLNAKVREDKNTLAFEYCSCLFRKSLLDNYGIRFPEDLRDMEDPIFTFQAALRCRKVIVVEDAYINIFHHASSSTAGVPDTSRVADKCRGLEILQRIANEADMSAESYAWVMALWCLVTVNNASVNRRLEARGYLGKTLKRFLKGLRHRKAFVTAADARWPGSGRYLTSCGPDDLPYLAEDMRLAKLEEEKAREVETSQKQLRRLQIHMARMGAQGKCRHANA